MTNGPETLNQYSNNKIHLVEKYKSLKIRVNIVPLSAIRRCPSVHRDSKTWRSKPGPTTNAFVIDLPRTGLFLEYEGSRYSRKSAKCHVSRRTRTNALDTMSHRRRLLPPRLLAVQQLANSGADQKRQTRYASRYYVVWKRVSSLPPMNLSIVMFSSALSRERTISWRAFSRCGSPFRGSFGTGY